MRPSTAFAFVVAEIVLILVFFILVNVGRTGLILKWPPKPWPLSCIGQSVFLLMKKSSWLQYEILQEMQLPLKYVSTILAVCVCQLGR